jgi:hypothetical protein
VNQQTKSAIKSLVLDLRHTLEDELAIVLRRYGVFTDRDWPLDAPPDRLTDPADREIWRRIVTVVRQGMREGRTLQEASQDYVRESAFTFLNRLVGLKCLEVRAIIDEIITTRDIYGGRSKAHRDYRDAHPREARAPDDALPAAVEAACRHVNDEMIGYLFDPDDDHSLVWPRYAVLKTCIARINDLDEAAWREDEIIGWIYQFYNAEEKKAVRDRGKPQTPHDVAVINQFFTPRWIVKFLVDNTLGRLWLEMHPGSSRVREKCDYLVPEPAPEAGGEDEDFTLDPDSPVNSPHAAPRRDEKPVTQIKLLDPACGTMHFGHYACEVFDAMYRDARDWGHLEIADGEIPGAILEHNLFGVDIDRRAVQLAALSLFMKARTMHPQARVTQINLVSADATLPDSGVKEQFLARYARTPQVQQAFAQVLEDMDQVAELGSLLRVEERLRDLLADAGHVATKRELEALDPRRQRDLPGMEPEVRQMGLAELAGDEEAATAWKPRYTLQELRDDLRAFARRALDEHDLNAQLFATEADKAVRLLDVLMGEYDVVVMNPPYGDTTSTAKEYLGSNYPDTKNDVYASFMERAIDFLAGQGYFGALTSRTYFYLSSFRRLRENILLKKGEPVSIVDLGGGVLDDAAVETSSIVYGISYKGSDICSFFKLDAVGDRETGFKELLGSGGPNLYYVSPEEFGSLPASPFAYWAPPAIRDLFQTMHRLQPKYATTRVGLQTGSDKRFVRFYWEIDQSSLGQRWQVFAKGGNYCRYYMDFNLVVDWGRDGYKIKHFTDEDGKLRSRPQNEDFYFRSGLTYINISSIAFSAQLLPPGIIFSVQGQGLFLKEGTARKTLLGILNSELVNYLLNLINPGRHFQAGHVANIPLAYPEPGEESLLADRSSKLHSFKSAWDTGNEISTRFTQPWLLQLARPAGEPFAQGVGRVLALLGDEAPPVELPEPVTLEALLDTARRIEQVADARLQQLQAEIDEAVYDLYEISPQDRALIERELGERPPELMWPEMEGKSDRAKREEHVKRFIYYYALQAVRADEDGIVPLTGGAGREPSLMDRVRARLEADFGPRVAFQLEHDAAEYIGRDVETQLHSYFFHHFHTGLYKKRPVLWHLTSDKKHFAVMLDYHRLDRDTLPKVRAHNLWPQMEAVRTRLVNARKEEAVGEIASLEDELADLEDVDQRLGRVIEGEVKVRLPKWARGPYRDGKPPYDPDLDDGVKVNLLPIQKAGLLPVKSVL